MGHLSSSSIAALLGMTAGRGGSVYFSTDDVPGMKRITHWLIENNRNVSWLVAVVRWVKTGKGREPDFWKKCIHTGGRALTQLANHLERGELGSQYDAHICQRNSDALNERMDGSRNTEDWLLRYWDVQNQQVVGVEIDGSMAIGAQLEIEDAE
jgi:hypothetical protein